jgi:hypothetical protein
MTVDLIMRGRDGELHFDRVGACSFVLICPLLRHLLMTITANMTTRT